MYLKIFSSLLIGSVLATSSFAGGDLDGTYVCKDNNKGIHLVKLSGKTWDTKDNAKKWMKKQMLANIDAAKKKDKTASGTFDIVKNGSVYNLEVNMISQGKPMKMELGNFTVANKNQIIIKDMMWQSQEVTCNKK